MIKKIYKVLEKLLPKKWLFSLKLKYRRIRSGFIRKMSREEFYHILTETMRLGRGDTVFVHSSISGLYIDFEPEEIYRMLLEIVGEEGTLLFPCWHFTGRAEDYAKKPESVFNVKRSTSKLGFLSEFARRQKAAVRSMHPTNSVAAIGKNAETLLGEHHLDIYPCGIKSPFYKIMDYQAKIIGIGVSVNNLSFCHVIEDVMQDKYLIETRNKEIYHLKVIDMSGKEHQVPTLVASQNISKRNPYKFFKKYIPFQICHQFRRKGADFFVADSVALYQKFQELTEKGLSIYNV